MLYKNSHEFCLRSPITTIITSDMVFFQFISMNSGETNWVNYHNDRCGVENLQKMTNKPICKCMSGEAEMNTSQVISEENFESLKFELRKKTGACNLLFFHYCKENGPSRQIETQESVRVYQHNWVRNINLGVLLHAFKLQDNRGGVIF